MPSPEETLRKGYYVPEELLARAGAEKLEHTEHCKRTVMGQLPNWLRERHGLPLLDEDKGWKYKPWLKHKKRKWDRMLEKEAAEAEGRELEPEKKGAKAKPKSKSGTSKPAKTATARAEPKAGAAKSASKEKDPK